MDRRDVEITEKQTVYQGYFRVDAYRLRHRLHAGGWSRELRREVFERGHAAAVLPYDPDRDTVLLLEQFRIGAYLADLPPWQTEVVAGIIDEGETAETVAVRETREETGCDILDLVPICRYLSSPGGMTESVALFCGRIDSRNAGGIHGLADEQEDIRVEVVPANAVAGLLEQGKIGNAVTIIALQWLLLHRDALRRRWGQVDSADR